MTADEKAAERERAHRIIDAHVAQLGEHFENVQVLVSTTEGEYTKFYARGTGSILARVAHAAQYVRTTEDYLDEGPGDDDED